MSVSHFAFNVGWKSCDLLCFVAFAAGHDYVFLSDVKKIQNSFKLYIACEMQKQHIASYWILLTQSNWNYKTCLSNCLYLCYHWNVLTCLECDIHVQVLMQMQEQLVYDLQICSRVCIIIWYEGGYWFSSRSDQISST